MNNDILLRKELINDINLTNFCKKIFENKEKYYAVELTDEDKTSIVIRRKIRLLNNMDWYNKSNINHEFFVYCLKLSSKELEFILKNSKESFNYYESSACLLASYHIYYNVYDLLNEEKTNGKDLNIWKIACDLFVNSIVGLNVPNEYYHPSQFNFTPGLSAEDYYNLLLIKLKNEHNDKQVQIEAKNLNGEKEQNDNIENNDKKESEDFENENSCNNENNENSEEQKIKSMLNNLNGISKDFSNKDQNIPLSCKPIFEEDTYKILNDKGFDQNDLENLRNSVIEEMSKEFKNNINSKTFKESCKNQLKTRKKNLKLDPKYEETRKVLNEIKNYIQRYGTHLTYNNMSTDISYHKLNNRRKNSSLILPGKILKQNGEIDKLMKSIVVFIDFSFSTSTINDILNDMGRSLFNNGMTIATYNRHLKNVMTNEYINERSNGGTSIENAYNQYIKNNETPKKLFIITDGKDDFDFLIENNIDSKIWKI